MKILLALLLMATPCYSADWSWDRMDTAREVAGTVVTVADYGQTQDIANHSGMVELNPILGRHPSHAAVRNYFATVMVLHPLISAALPKKATLLGCDLSPRLAWQYFYIGVEATAVASNYNGGLRFSF